MASPSTWDDRYARGEGVHGFVPSPPLPAAIAGVAPGTALDVACGAGRHALYLAERGWRVIGLDASRVGLDAMLAEARRRGVADRIDARVVDLEAPGVALPPGRFDLVLDFYFLHRPLFDGLRAAVRPGGLFVAAIHVESDDAPHRFLLARGELEAMVRGWGWDVLHAAEGGSREGGHDHATAEIVARSPGLSPSPDPRERA